VSSSVPVTQHAPKYSSNLHQCTTFIYMPIHTYIYVCVYTHIYIYMYILTHTNTHLKKQRHLSKAHLSSNDGCDQERKERLPTSQHSLKIFIACLATPSMRYSTSAQQRCLLQKNHLPSKGSEFRGSKDFTQS
jgi:hypothetical protein